MFCAGLRTEASVCVLLKGVRYGNMTSGDDHDENYGIFLMGFIHSYYDYLGLTLMFMCWLQFLSQQQGFSGGRPK